MSERKFTLTPDQADFDEVLIGKKDKLKLELQNLDTTTVTLEVVSEPTDEFVKKFKIKREKLKPEQSTKIEIELNNDLPPGAFKTALTLQPEGQSDKRFTIPITGKVVEKLSPTRPVASSSNKTPANAKQVSNKVTRDEQPKTQTNVQKKPQVLNKPSSGPAKRPIPLGTIDDSDLK